MVPCDVSRSVYADLIIALVYIHTLEASFTSKITFHENCHIVQRDRKVVLISCVASTVIAALYANTELFIAFCHIRELQTQSLFKLKL